jgi:hypothetical protein
MPKSKINPPASGVGVAWYRPEQWEMLRNASVDKDKLEDTHAEWQKDAERVVKELRQQGFYVVKIDVEIADLLLWCESQEIPLNGEARSKYAAFKVQQLSQ